MQRLGPQRAFASSLPSGSCAIDVSDHPATKRGWPPSHDRPCVLERKLRIPPPAKPGLGEERSTTTMTSVPSANCTPFVGPPFLRSATQLVEHEPRQAREASGTHTNSPMLVLLPAPDIGQMAPLTFWGGPQLTAPSVDLRIQTLRQP